MFLRRRHQRSMRRANSVKEQNHKKDKSPMCRTITSKDSNLTVASNIRRINSSRDTAAITAAEIVCVRQNNGNTNRRRRRSQSCYVSITGKDLNFS